MSSTCTRGQHSWWQATLLAMILVFGSGAVLAAGAPKPLPEPDPDALPHHIVKSIIQGFKQRLRETHGKPDEVREKMIGELVDHHFQRFLDIEDVTQQIFAEHWDVIEERGLALQAQATVRQAVRQRYVNALKNYDRQRIRVFKARTQPDPETEREKARVHLTVDASIKTLPLDVYFHQNKDGDWLIKDVRVLGTSVVDAGQAAVSRGVRVLGLDAVLDKLTLDGESE